MEKRDKNALVGYLEGYIKPQMPGFLREATALAIYIQNMQKRKLISERVKSTGRIKSFLSASANDREKVLDDIFGFRIVADANELDIIEKTLPRIMNITDMKDHRIREKTSFNGIHFIGTIGYGKPTDDTPVKTELQLWTHELERRCTSGDLAYQKYKTSDEKGGVLTKEDIITMFIRGKFTEGYNIPYEFELKDGKVRRLSIREIVELQFGVNLSNKDENGQER